MTRLLNDAAEFAREMTEGFVEAHPTVRAVRGGVARAAAVPPGRVAVVIGGGSGHFPAFAGLVGEGLAAGAALGNTFASPAAAQVASVARAVENGGGVLLAYGNYAGDVLNFNEAQRMLRDDGIRCESVAVTDDISSAPANQRHLRRGIAGGLAVYKCAGAAADAGYSLDDVVRVARHANDRTRSLGVAFDGCTLPGAPAPLFRVPSGKMALGMGIHGEPGLAELDMPTANELAAILVRRLLKELPDSAALPTGRRVVPILNGLGSVKYEELYVLYRGVSRLLDKSGLHVVDPQVGEFCTSFDMAGLSLTLFWPDEELEGLWGAPADAPAYRTRASAAPASARPRALETAPDARTEGSPASRALARTIADLVDAAATAVDEAAAELGRLDAVAGDGDHGIGMKRGIAAARHSTMCSVDERCGAGTLLIRAGDAWALEAGGTSGALWGGALRALGGALGDAEVPTPDALADLVAVGVSEVERRGGAQVGDKTMVDAMEPFRLALARALDEGSSVPDACALAARAATIAAAATADLVPRVGRARPHAERSLGTPDPGASSFALICSAAAGALQAAQGSLRG